MLHRSLLIVLVLLKGLALGADAPAKATAVKPAAADLEKFAKDLGSDDFATREAASKGLIAAGEAARATAEKLKKSEDTEVRERAEEIVRTLNTPKDMLALNADQKELANLPFESSVSDDGKTVTFKNYAHHTDYFVSDFGNIRVVIEQTPFNGSTSGSMSISGGGSTSIKAGSFSVQSSGDKTNISFRKLNWKIEKSIMMIAGQEVPFGGGANKVLFLNKDGGFLKRCDLPAEKGDNKK